MKCFIYINSAASEHVLNNNKIHSEFQYIIALNLPYCDEYLILADSDNFNRVEQQLYPFHQLPYRIYDISGKAKPEAVIAGCRELETDDEVMVIDAGYFNNIIRLAELSSEAYKDIVITSKKQLATADSIIVSRIDLLFFNSGELLRNPDIINQPQAFSMESALDFVTAFRRTDKDFEPLVKLAPAFKDYLWGGNRLAEIYGKKSKLDVIAESWELSAHPDGQSTIASGKYKGVKFREYLSSVGKSALGWKCRFLEDFPLLVKFIDAKDDLSVQVHPDDDYALSNENQFGKNEMWYVIDSKPGAGLYVGFNKDVSRGEVEKRIKNGTVLEILNFYPVKAGDVFFIPAGTIHAIGAGILICEIQQNSNCTYRLYDYSRTDQFGNHRELNLDKALDVLDYNKYEAIDYKNNINSSTKVLGRCKYFESTLYRVKGETELSLEGSYFYAAVCIKGEGTLQIGEYRMKIKGGESVFIPAQKSKLILSGELSVIICHI